MGKSLEDIHGTVDTGIHTNFFRRTLSFLGPAFLISVGYMDPGNWATDLAAGSRYGYSLLWVLVLSNIMALVLQSLSARLGLVRGLDLAQASKETFPRFVNFSLYLLAELAIAATDLAEVIGMAIGLQLLFDIPLLIGVLITFFDTFLLLFLINKGIRKMEAFILSLIFVIGLCFGFEMFFAQPVVADVAKGLVPSLPDSSALYLAIGIIGATVMPHNLYLHSALVQTRKYGSGADAKRKAIRFNFIDSAVALNIALFVNAAIIILAGAAFYTSGNTQVADIQDAHALLTPLLGASAAPILFAIALIAAGQSSTLTGTLAGQIVMEGYINLRIQAWLRRILTRALAIIPAVIVIVFSGERHLGDLLIFSQVILSLQLGFAVIPLIHFVSNKQKMGEFVIKPWLKTLSWCIAILIVILNGKLVINILYEQIVSSQHPLIWWFTAVPTTIGAAALLLYITIYPFVKQQKPIQHSTHRFRPYELAISPAYQRVIIAIDFSSIDTRTINSALSLGTRNASYQLIHVMESAGARLWGNETADREAIDDPAALHEIAQYLSTQGYSIETRLGYGNPKKMIPKMVQEYNADLLVMGSHGHKGITDIIFGTVLDSIRHKITIPLFIVRPPEA